MHQKLTALCLLAALPTCLHGQPLFDAHLHYTATDAAVYSPAQIINRLERNDIRRAVVTGTPASYAQRLYHADPARIVPILGAYRGPDDKATWPGDTSLPARIEAELAMGRWCGIGELHLFGKDRHSPVFNRIVKLAERHNLVLQIHGDAAVIDSVYDLAPTIPVIWAHAGKHPYPDLLADYLERYPGLSVDLSVRDARIAPDGEISDEWYELFVQYPGRFMVGVDTYSASRWQDFDSVVSVIRRWLTQLPEAVASRIGHDNAAALFQKCPPM